MSKFLKVIDDIILFIEVNVSSVLFSMLVVGFVVNIISRYFFGFDMSVVNEVTIICFTWMTLFAASNGTRENAHVAFTILYDSVGKKSQAVINVLGKTFLILSFLVLLLPSIETVSFFGIRKTSMLKLSFSILYAPYIFFVCATLFHAIRQYIVDLKNLKVAFTKTEN